MPASSHYSIAFTSGASRHYQFLTAAPLLISSNTQAVLALGALPRFFVSPIFAEWREAQAAAGTLILFRATSGLGPPKSENTVNPIEDILLGQLDTMLGCNEWLRALLSSLENIPVCVSVAAATSASRGFPLIYVNKSFERATGYQRSEVLGKNCKFLQTGKHGETAEPESIAKLTTALAAKQGIKITITNFRKDGSPFRNLLAVKPIFDEKG
jgi:PAS domain S-box-containing protein